MNTPRPEYPRPHFDRSHSWTSLNGVWEFAEDPLADGEGRGLLDGGTAWTSSITVPFAWETSASGVGRQWLACGWYRRSVDIDPAWDGQRVVIHFGAVHHHATVWVNGTLMGGHEGGYTPFELDITDALDNRAGTLVVRVEAPVDKRFLVHGKQRSVPVDDYDGCSFTPSSGIWQSVWLEARPATYIERLDVRPAPSLDAFEVIIEVKGPQGQGLSVNLQVSGGSSPVTTAVLGDRATITLPITDARLWQQADPHLYDVTATLVSSSGTDTVTVQAGLRQVHIEDGHLVLNGERLYVRGVLDQGYWPQTGITAPDDHAFVRDLELAAEAGFNLVRKHLKLEDPRFLWHADQLGMLVWAEPASTGRFSAEAAQRFEAQIEPMTRRDGNHPSIVIWGLYNEEWGLDWDVPGDVAKQDAVRSAYRMLKALDDTRPVVDNSGWAHVETDLVDWHVYDEHPNGWADKLKAFLVDGEDHIPVPIAINVMVDKLLMSAGGALPAGVPNLNSEFGGGQTSVDRGWNMRWQTQELRRYDEISGYVWTELYDIEHETAGVYTFDRLPKDDGGNPAGDYNAETVLVVDVRPLRPGRDLVVASAEFSVDVHISSYAEHKRELTLVTAWGPLMSTRFGETQPAAEPLVVAPYELSDAITLRTSLPDGTTAARLHIQALHEGEVVGSTCLDVARQD